MTLEQHIHNVQRFSLILTDDWVVALQRDVLAAAAADADHHLSISASVALSNSCINCPCKTEVECANCPTDDTDVADDDGVVTNWCQNASDYTRKPENDERINYRSGQVDSLELSASGLDLLLMLRQFWWTGSTRYFRLSGWYSVCQWLVSSVLSALLLCDGGREVTAVVWTDAPAAGLAFMGSMRRRWRQAMARIFP